MKTLSEWLGGKGGGKPNFAQVGGPNITLLTEAALIDLVSAHLRGLNLIA